MRRPDADALVPGPDVCAALGISRATFRTWAARYRDLMPSRGREPGPHGAQLYRYGDVCAIAQVRATAGRRPPAPEGAPRGD